MKFHLTAFHKKKFNDDNLIEMVVMMPKAKNYSVNTIGFLDIERAEYLIKKLQETVKKAKQVRDAKEWLEKGKTKLSNSGVKNV